MSNKVYKIFFWSVIVFGTFLFLWKLGGDAFIDYDEATYAQVIRASVAAADLLSFRISPTSFWFEKPPLYFWLAILASKIISLETFAFRLPAALSGLAGVILVMMIAYEATKNRLSAIISGLILSTTGAYLEAARQVRMDAPVSAAILFSFYSFLKGRSKPLWYLGVGTGVAVGVFFKSVIGFLVFPIIGIWSLINWDFGWLKNKFFWIGNVLGAAILLPWHFYEHLKFGDAFWNVYFSRHILDRFNEDILGGALPNSLYLNLLTSFSLPWVLLFFISLFFYLTVLPLDRESRKDFSFAAIAIFIIGVFLFSKTKLLYYFVPVYPFVALFLGAFFVRVYNKFFSGRVVAAALIFLLFFSFAFKETVSVGFHSQATFKNTKILAEEESRAGEAIKKIEEAKPVSERIAVSYVKNHNFLETLRYYSGGINFEALPPGLVREAHYLVVPSEYSDAEIKSNPKYKPVYQGDILTVLSNF